MNTCMNCSWFGKCHVDNLTCGDFDKYDNNDTTTGDSVDLHKFALRWVGIHGKTLSPDLEDRIAKVLLTLEGKTPEDYVITHQHIMDANVEASIASQGSDSSNTLIDNDTNCDSKDIDNE